VVREARLVEVAHHGEVDVAEHVAVEHEHGAGGEVGGVADAAPRSQRLRLDDVAQAHAEMLGLAESRPHVVHPV